MIAHVTRGFTLIELVVTMVVMVILTTIAAPSFNSFIERYRVKRAADAIDAFLINTKSEAIKRNATVRAVFQTADSGATWCIGMTTASTCDCTVASACQIDGADRLLKSSDYKNIVMTSPADGAMFSFSPLRGTVNSGNAQIQSSSGSQIRVEVLVTGKIRLCSPSGSGNVGGYSVCS